MKKKIPHINSWTTAKESKNTDTNAEEQKIKDAWNAESVQKNALDKMNEELEVRHNQVKEEEEKITERENILKEKENTIEKRIEDIGRSILRKRVDLEYALNKSAIEELWFDHEDFYIEVEDKIKNEVWNKKYYNRLEKSTMRHIIWNKIKGLFDNKKSQLNFVLPTLRASYLGEWKEFLMDAGREIIKPDGKKINPEDIELIDSKMAIMIGKFDEILGKDQDRNLRSRIFNWILRFLVVETIVVFWISGLIIYTKSDNKEILTILMPATIVQITAMLFYIVRSLFPKWDNKEETEKDLQDKIKVETLKQELEKLMEKKATPEKLDTAVLSIEEAPKK